MKKARLNVLFLATLILFPVVSICAWDDVGHKITAYIAWQQMTPDVRDRVIKILTSAPEDSQLAAFYLPYGSRSEEARRRYPTAEVRARRGYYVGGGTGSAAAVKASPPAL